MTDAVAGVPGESGATSGELLYRDGKWTRFQSPLSRSAEDWDAAVEQAGYEEFFSSGEADVNVLVIKVHKGASDYLIELESISRYEYVFAATLPDVMDLLAKWMPVVSAVVTGNLLNELNGGSPNVTDLLRAAWSRK
ncbi:hypothetical protein [Streptomyces rimosus]|uniref:hypothetical protein n=1 Tax=Streptomyces rimosus TaxID=1927 RepID=UPI0037D13539